MRSTGTTAYDYLGGNNGAYNNVTLNQPGYSVADPDTCISLPANPANRGYVQSPTTRPSPSPAPPTFTFEGWVNFTNPERRPAPLLHHENGRLSQRLRLRHQRRQ